MAASAMAQTNISTIDNILQYLFDKQKRDHVSPIYIHTKQTEISERLRTKAFDWINGLHRLSGWDEETLFLIYALIDKYLSRQMIPAKNFPTLIAVIIVIATKYSEDISVNIDELLKTIGATGITKQMILWSEINVLFDLKFDIGLTTPIHFIDWFNENAQNDNYVCIYSKYILEVTYLNYKSLKYLASEFAAGALYLSRYINNVNPSWVPVFSFYTKCEEDVARSCAKEMLIILHRNRKYVPHIIEKYSSVKYSQVALKKIPEKFPQN